MQVAGAKRVPEPASQLCACAHAHGRGEICRGERFPVRFLYPRYNKHRIDVFKFLAGSMRTNFFRVFFIFDVVVSIISNLP